MSDLPASITPLGGQASDALPDVLQTGQSEIAALFVSMAERHPTGDDASYLYWHTMDHRPEQMRLPEIQASLRVVSTPECRAARGASVDTYDAVDHVMTYFFTDIAGLDGFGALSDALHAGGRTPFVLPPVDRGVFVVSERRASPRVKAGADVLPWLPIRGAYVLLETEADEAPDLTGIDGVAGQWSTRAVASPVATVAEDDLLTFLFLDGDPVVTAVAINAALQSRWQRGHGTPRLAAPFYCVVPFEWTRYLP